MNPEISNDIRAYFDVRDQFIQKMVLTEIQRGVSQYVILGSGTESFAQRNPELASTINIYEVDQDGPHLVSGDFDAEEFWWKKLIESGFDVTKPAVVSSIGVTMFITKESIQLKLARFAKLATGSTFVMNFLISPELLEDQELISTLSLMRRAQESGATFLSLFRPEDILNMARNVGLRNSLYFSASDLQNYLGRKRTNNSVSVAAEGFLVGHI